MGVAVRGGPLSAGVAVAGVVVVSGVVGVVLVPVAPPATVVVPAAVGTVVAVAAVPPSRERNCCACWSAVSTRSPRPAKSTATMVGKSPRSWMHRSIRSSRTSRWLACEAADGSARPFLLTQWLMSSIGADAGPRLGWQSNASTLG